MLQLSPLNKVFSVVQRISQKPEMQADFEKAEASKFRSQNAVTFEQDLHTTKLAYPVATESSFFVGKNTRRLHYLGSNTIRAINSAIRS
jgi:hypothetical protein